MSCILVSKARSNAREASSRRRGGGSLLSRFVVLAALIGALGLFSHQALPVEALAFQLQIVDRNDSGFDNDDENLIDAVLPVYGGLGFTGGTDFVPGNGSSLFLIDTYFANVGDSVWLGLAVSEGGGNVTLNSNGVGEFVTAICNDNDGDNDDFEEPDDECNNTTFDDDHMTIPDAGNVLNTGAFQAEALGIAVEFVCTGPGVATIEFSQGGQTLTYFIVCHGDFDHGTLSASNLVLEMVPVPGNTDHSLIQLQLFDEYGGTVPEGVEIDWSVNRCGIETEEVDTLPEAIAVYDGVVPLYLTVGPDVQYFQDHSGAFVYDFNEDGVLDSIGLAIVHCDPLHVPEQIPGPIVITARVEIPDEADQVLKLTISSVGPPAQLGMRATPAVVVCGQHVVVQVQVLDIVSQPVSDGTAVVLDVTQGGTLYSPPWAPLAPENPHASPFSLQGLNPFSPVGPISSTTGYTIGGMATAYMLTSMEHIGVYTISATVRDLEGLALPTSLIVSCIPTSEQEAAVAAANATPVASPAPAQPAPSGIRPPNTGDAGLR